ncbi:MAG: polysaccharide biosynthesis C-terminal domain-containing protein [Acidobacteria bacterium]|nr:polysaccharide biosynthesis C-terminal domain-containing protein [Acidobacteriota bacterium]
MFLKNQPIAVLFLLERMLRGTSTIASAMLLARHSTLLEYGEFASAFSFSQLVGMSASLGLDQIIQGKGPSSRHRRATVSAALKLRAVTAFFGAFLFYAIYLYAINPKSSTVQFALSAFVALQFADILSAIAIYSDGARLFVNKKLAITVLFSCFKVGAAVAGANVASYVILLCFEQLLSGVVFSRYARTFWSRPFNLPYCSIIRDGTQMSFAQIVVLAYSRLDGLLILQILGAERAGAFLAVSRITEASSFISQAVLSGTLSSRATLFAKSPADAESLHVVSGRQLVTIYFSLGVLALVFGPTIIDATIGPKYRSYSSVLVVGLFANAFVSLGLLKDQWLLASGKIRQIGKTNLITLFANVVVLLVLVYPFGVLGASYAFLLTQFCSAILSLYIVGEAKLLQMQLRCAVPIMVAKGGIFR